jgi:hypothetical protein
MISTLIPFRRPLNRAVITANPESRFSVPGTPIVPVDCRNDPDDRRTFALHAPCRALHDTGMTTTILGNGA